MYCADSFTSFHTQSARLQYFAMTNTIHGIVGFMRLYHLWLLKCCQSTMVIQQWTALPPIPYNVYGYFIYPKDCY